MRRLVFAAFVAAFVSLTMPALAHVEVSPETANKGGSSTFTFNVEDERDSANEVTVEFYLPAGLTQANVTPTAPAGWDFVFTVSPGSVRFTHAAPGPAGDQSFTLAITELPDSDTVVFKTVVTYDNGDIDRWIDLPTGGKEPPHPAAVVKLAGSGATTVTTTEAKTTPITVKRPDQGSNKGVIAGVIIAAVLVVGGLVTYALRGRRSS
jgi:uncharacterized protein YcnI